MKKFSYGKPCIPLSATETSCSLVVNRGNDGVKFQSPGVQSCKNIHSRIQVDFAVVMDMQQRETGQPLLPHCCSHVVVEPTQCACTSLTLTRNPCGGRLCCVSKAYFFSWGSSWSFCATSCSDSQSLTKRPTSTHSAAAGPEGLLRPTVGRCETGSETSWSAPLRSSQIFEIRSSCPTSDCPGWTGEDIPGGSSSIKDAPSQWLLASGSSLADIRFAAVRKRSNVWQVDAARFRSRSLCSRLPMMLNNSLHQGHFLLQRNGPREWTKTRRFLRAHASCFPVQCGRTFVGSATVILAGGHVRASAGALAVHTALIPCLCVSGIKLLFHHATNRDQVCFCRQVSTW